jgi:L-amino acid N-acyltransferase YncA
VRVRPAREADAAAIAAIHNEGIADRIATFEVEPRSAKMVASQLAEAARPCLVAVEDDEILGWARATSFGERACYAGVAEASVYVASAARGRGTGRILLGALAQACETAGDWKLLALIFPENEASLALFASGGFRVVGTYERHGRLDGEWRDVVLMERPLGVATST